MSRSTIIRKIGKVILWGIGSILVLCLVIFLLLRVPHVQNHVVDYVARSMSERIGTKFTIDAVNLKFFKKVSLSGIYLEDMESDTLLYVDGLDVELGVLAVFRRKININSISLDGARINLSRTEGDSSYNFQFLIDAFSSNEIDTSASPWDIGFDKVKIRDALFHHDDKEGKMSLFADIGTLAVYADRIDLNGKVLDLGQIGLGDTKFSYRDFSESTVVSSEVIADTTKTISFPGFDWDLSVRQIRIDQGAFIYDVASKPVIKNSVNFQHLDIDNINLAVDDLQWNDEFLGLYVKRGALEDQSGFVLNELTTKYEMSSQFIHVDDLILVTPNSKVKTTTDLDFNQYSDLTEFVDSVRISSRFSESKISYVDLNYLVPQLRNIENLNLNLKENILLDGGISGPVSDLRIDDLSAKIPGKLTLDLTGSISGLPSPSTTLDVKLKELSTSYAALKRLTRGVDLPEGIEPWGKFNLSGAFRGQLSDMKATKVTLSTGSVTGFKGDLAIKGLPNIDNTIFDLRVEELRSTADDLDGFAAEGMPPAMDSLGQFFYTGFFQGTIYDFKVDGRLVSDAGDVDTNFDMSFEKDFSNAEYSGDISTDSFNLKKVFSLESLGYLSMDVHSYGEGLNFSNLKTVVMGDVQRLDIMGYDYEGLQIDGRFDKKQFSGHAEIHDENVEFNFEGVISLTDTLSKLRFKSRIDTIDFKALNLMDQELAMSARINSDFKGGHYLTMKGDVLISDLNVSNLDHTYNTDSIYVLSDNSDVKNKLIEITSEVLNGQIKGDYDFISLPALLKEYVNNYFPFGEVVDRPDMAMDSLGSKDSIVVVGGDTIAEEKGVAHQDITFQLSLIDAQPILSLVASDLVRLDTVMFTGRINTVKDSISLNTYISRMKYGGASIGSANFYINGDSKKLDNVLQVNDIKTPGNLQYPYLYTDVILENDSLYSSLVLSDTKDRTKTKLGFAATMVSDNDYFLIHLNESFYLNTQEWGIDRANAIKVNSTSLGIENMIFSQGTQRLELFSDDLGQTDIDYLPVEVEFDKFEIGEISSFLNQEGSVYDGTINGKVAVQKIGGRTGYLADLILDDLTLQDEQLGVMTIKSSLRGNDIVDVMVKLDGNVSGLDIRGTYNTGSDMLDIQGEVDRLKLETLDPFLKGFIHDSRGELSGLINIGGTSAVPMINGSFEMDQLSTIVDYLQGRYTFKNEEIEINQNKILFRNFEMNDLDDHKAVINGSAQIVDAGNLSFDLDVKTDEFVVLNTTAKDNDLFYGKLIVGANVHISGDTENPVLQVNAKTLKGTHFAVQPLSYEASLTQESFIIFANPETYVTDTTSSIQDLYKLNEYGIDLTANLELTSDAELRIVVDPSTGDELVCRGEANLNVKMSPTGDLQILGIYSITEGQYAFSFQRVLKRTFDIDKGSSVTFSGDPLKSRFDITATYGLRTTTYELISNQSTLNTSEEAKSKQRTRVEVKLNLEGSLEKPSASFDIQIPEESGGVTSTVSGKLVQLREDEASLNKQVFGLLIFNSFIAEEQSTGAATMISGAGQSALISSVGGLLTNQLNSLANKYIKGVDLDFGVDSYTNNFDGDNSLVTELQVGLSKRLLNDRLSVKIGGNVQFDNDESIELTPGSNSNFSGDFVLEYKLTEDGNYRLKFFQLLSDEEQIFNPGVNYSETGVSIFFTKSFNSKKYRTQTGEVLLDN